MKYYRDLFCNWAIKILDYFGQISPDGPEVPTETTIRMKEKTKMAKRVNMNDIANTVAIKEQGTYEMNIAQIKQVLRIFLEEMSSLEDEQILELVKRYR
jgi:predicted  nucleic acid-binding Zn-ribbon protein